MGLPFTILPTTIVLGVVSRFPSIGRWIIQSMKFIESDVNASNIDYSPQEYGGAIAVITISNAVILFLLFNLFTFAININEWIISLLLPSLISIGVLLSLIFYPKVKAIKRIKEIDGQLIYALRHMHIEMKSGVTLFESMKSISVGYGEVSIEFSNIVESVNLGISESDALKEAGRGNPSAKFRRILWQISNALKTGSDLVKELDETINELKIERSNEIKDYIQELSPWTMLYMVVAIVVPALSISMFNMFLSFLSIELPKITLLVIPGALLLFQIFFIYFVKTRMPKIQ